MFKKICLILLTSVLGVAIIICSSIGTRTALFIPTAATANPTPTIVLDAGHGGEDGGTSSDFGMLEKDVNLQIALTLEKLLLQSGLKVKMIRETDTSIHDDTATTTRERKVSDIHNRVKIANSSNNNILISIHQNYFTDSKYFGTQIFYSQNNGKSSVLAENLRASVTGLLQPTNTRACKKAENIFLLDNVTTPAVIVECGFLSNDDEAYLLSKSDYRDNMAYCIYLGIIEFIHTNY